MSISDTILSWSRGKKLTKLQKLEAPTLSILVPIFNAEEYLASKLQNLMQVLDGVENIEVILSINKSSDSTERMIREIIHELPENFEIFFQPEFLEGSNQFRWLTEHARGIWIMFSAVDDFLEKESLTGISAILQNHSKNDFVSGVWRYTPSLHGDNAIKLGLAGEINERLTEILQNIRVSHGVFYSIQSKDTWTKFWLIFETHEFHDWIFVIFLVLNGKNRHIPKFEINFTAKGSSREKHYLQRKATSKIGLIFPYLPLLKSLFKLAKMDWNFLVRYKLVKFAISLIYGNLHRFFWYLAENLRSRQ